MAYRELSPLIYSSISSDENDSFDLDRSIERIAHWLPTQGPIKDFIHHNTLHSLEHISFHQAIAAAARIFGARSYLPKSDYQNLYRNGRIKDFALDWAITQSGVTDTLKNQQRDALFEIDDSGHYPPLSLANHGIRTAWLNRLEVDLNSLVHPPLFRLLANFLDQGISRWVLPKKNESFWDCVLRLARNSFLPLYPFNEPVIQDLLSGNPSHELTIMTCLDEIVGNQALYEQYLLEMLLAHPGWSGIVHFVERNPSALLMRRDISLKQTIAVELLAELAFLYRKKGSGFPKVKTTGSTETLTIADMKDSNTSGLASLRIWHEAMEWSLHIELLQALRNNDMAPLETSSPSVQALFCLDDRECSLRRHLEEIDPAIETFGAAGFFGIDFLYQGLDDAYPVAQCPNTVKPKHLIKESSTQRRTQAKTKNHEFSERSLLRTWLHTQTLGLGYAAKLAWQVFRPTSQLPGIEHLGEVEAHSRLHLLRDSDEPNDNGYVLGFSLSEMADRVGGLLNNIGLTRDFAALVVVVAHGSSSVNNPHFAAYDCGACSGKPGAPNARAFAWMANQGPVRTLLRERGIDIPDNTRFIAALHNTSRDEILYLDNPPLPPETATIFRTFKQSIRQALERNALERSRWFELAPKSLTNKAAHRHVVERASSIFEPRPELNHSNNLYCIIGRRKLTRHLFLDRRAFLHSYDPTQDSQGDALSRILSAIIPVCGGINLEYLFSRIDNSVYGAGTKLPHNVIGLLGVANGVEGDLRTGLPSQMIEVHEPARLLIVVDQSCAVLDRALSNIGEYRRWLDNEWVRLVACDPQTRDQSLYTASGWESVDLPNDFDTPSTTASECITSGKTGTIPVHRIVRK